MTTEAVEQRWRLQAWNHRGDVILDDSLVGDRALNDAVALVEKRKDFRRFSVRPDAKTGRPAIVAPPGPPPPDPFAPPATCLECDLTEPECRRYEATSGHTFTEMRRP